MAVAGNSALLRWFEIHGRDLPWRRTREPWSILVAELMLQQTQVSRVVDRWPRFLNRFPDPASCAAASVGEVIDEWSGLGYNRRAVNLHRTATALVADHSGKVPSGLTDLLALPGIGGYTARAVRVFAFELDDAVVDTNVARILARRAGKALAPSEAQRTADGLVPAGKGWAWNQALLDLGSMLCRAGAQPSCVDCPMRSSCRWAAIGNTGTDPAIGSAGVSGGQPRFWGSDRQGRGRLVLALRGGPIREGAVADAMGWPDDPERVDRVLDRLIAEGLIVRENSVISLPS